MIRAFDKLNDSEIEVMLRAPVVVCILIAGADGKIDRKEILEAIDVARENADRAKASLQDYFKIMEEDFEDKLKVVIQSLPANVEERNQLINEELTQLNSIWPKLDKTFASEFYATLLDLTKKIASSSGGLLGIKSVGDEEARYIDLPMVKNPTA